MRGIRRNWRGGSGEEFDQNTLYLYMKFSSNNYKRKENLL